MRPVFDPTLPSIISSTAAPSTPTATSSKPPDLWETYLEPKYRDRALRLVRDENGLEELEIGGARAKTQRRGFPSTLGAMGDPDLAACSRSRHDLRRQQPYGAWIPAERLKLLDAEGHRRGRAVHDDRPAVGGRARRRRAEPGLHAAPTTAGSASSAAAERPAGPDRAPVARRSRGGGGRARARRRRRRTRRVRRAVHPRRHGRSAIPTTIRCSPAGRTSTCRSPSIPTFEPQWTQGRAHGHWEHVKQLRCSRRSRRPTACASSSRRCSTTACSTGSRS